MLHILFHRVREKGCGFFMYIEKVDEKRYNLKKEAEIFGEFLLVPTDSGARRLEQLHVSENIAAGQVLEIFELIQVYIKDEGIAELHVESHSDTLDILLQHQRFHLKNVENRLWIYQVNHN